MLSTILFNIFVVLSTAFVIVLAYAIRSNKNEFDIYCWFVTNRIRFIFGAVLGSLVSVLIVSVPETDALLQIIGFNASKTPISIGLALGAFLIAAVSGNSPKQ